MSGTPADGKVSCVYGAPMGRRSDTAPLTGRVHLARVRLNGDYDNGGAYWGMGAPLFVAWDDEGAEVYVRAADRNAAKAKIALAPGARFYR